MSSLHTFFIEWIWLHIVFWASVLLIKFLNNLFAKKSLKKNLTNGRTD